MGALDECHFDAELENGVDLGETMGIEDAVRVLLQGLGEDVDREGLRKTPLRVAKALREGTRGYHQNVKDIVSGALFPEAGLETKSGHAGGAGGLVIVRDLDFFSYCESCLLPFQVKCHVGYIPSGHRVVGLSKLSRVAEVFAKRLQDPSRLAQEISSALQQSIKPSGVAVVLQCSHINFPDFQSAVFDPNHKGWVKTSFKSGSGVFENETADIWSDFFGLLKSGGLNVEFVDPRGPVCKHWCPSKTDTGSLDPAMLGAISSIICSLEDNSSRKELLETPARFLNWLMNFKSCKLDMKMNGFAFRNRNFGLDEGEQQHMLSELNLPFWSQCEHHLLPFHGVVHVGYHGPNRANNSAVRSLLQPIVHFYGFKLQVQERLTRQIAESVSSLLGEDVMVVVVANHTCMISRGIEKLGSSTATFALLGRFSTDPTARAKFLQVIPSSKSS